MFFHSLVTICLALSGAWLVAAVPRIHAREDYAFATVRTQQRRSEVFSNSYCIRGFANIKLLN
jgi:hypothetical protein